jgi:hypothetical protein
LMTRNTWLRQTNFPKAQVFSLLLTFVRVCLCKTVCLLLFCINIMMRTEMKMAKRAHKQK